MGVNFDRILDGFDGPFEKVTGLDRAAGGDVTGPAQPAGYLLSAAQNDSFILVNRLLKNGDEVYRLPKGGAGLEGPGTLFVPARPQNAELVAKARRGISAEFA